MFEIDYLITSSVYDRLNAHSCIEDKTDFLLKLIDFDINFPDIADEISCFWYENTGERYNSEEYFIDSSTRALIFEYAAYTNNIQKVKGLINKLLSVNDGVYAYDEIVGEVENEMSVISCIDDFEFTDNVVQSNIGNKKTSIDKLLGFKPNKP